MRDAYGRIKNKSQVIRNLDKLRLAYLFDDVKRNPDKYPSDRIRWLEWLNADSGDNLDNL